MQIHNQICNLLYYWTERRTWKSKRTSPGFQTSLALKKNKYVLEQGFLAFKLSNIFYMRHRDWGNPFSFHAELLQDFIPRMYYNYRIENQAYDGTSRRIVYSRHKKRWHSASPVGLSWDSPHPPPESVRAYADVRTNIFWIKRFTKFAYPWCSTISAIRSRSSPQIVTTTRMSQGIKLRSKG